MKTAILWFRRDLRLNDNPALQAALMSADRLLPVYIHAPDEEFPWQPGAASRWWLHHSLQRLDQSLQALGSRLVVLEGDSREILERLIARHAVSQVFWNRLYEQKARERDTAIKADLQGRGVVCASYNAALLHEPWQVQTQQGGPYRVFTAYWRACLKSGLLQSVPVASPARLPPLPDGVDTLAVEELRLLPAIDWYAGLAERWQPGEAGALHRLADFLPSRVEEYAKARDLPADPGTSGLSPHLHFGEIGPSQIAHAILARLGPEVLDRADAGPAVYLKELGWREFAHHLLYHFPHTSESALDSRFHYFPWKQGAEAEQVLQAWRCGKTGFPIVDAGLRELWHTGWMHNRVRMIVASLLTKNMGVHWLEGARWFWDTLVDADLANNTLGWQWTAGCGADAAPFFRIFNPVSQSVRFDPQGRYLRRWLPELARLSDAQIHAPWLVDPLLLKQAGIVLGKDYPLPIVDLDSSRKQVLQHWDQMKTIPKEA